MKIYNKLQDFYYNVKAFIDNLKWMIPEAWKFRCWDYSHNIDLFAKSLEITGNTIIKYGNCLTSKKHGRRAIFAAYKLKTAYNYYSDNSISYLNKENKIKFTQCFLTRDYKYSEEDFYKLYNTAQKRVLALETNRKKEAWQYLHKYIEHFWE